MPNICIHDNIKETCSRCKEVSWRVAFYVPGIYCLKEFYTEKVRDIPKRYLKQVCKLVRSKQRARVKLCNCEMELQKIIEKVLKGKKK